MEDKEPKKTEEESDSLFKSKLYFNFGDAVSDVGMAHGVTDTLLATGLLTAKTLSNTAVFTGKLGIEILKRIPDTVEKNSRRELNENKTLSPIERAKHEESLAKVAEFKRKQEEIRNRHKEKN